MKFPRSFLLLSVLALPLTAFGAVRTVTTVDNDSPAADGLLSLKEAIEQLQEGDTIAFALLGEGPHYIVTPAEGYPPITRRNIVIDGYTQPGAVKNGRPLAESNEATLKVVLDSRDGGRYSLAAYGDRGFGDSESAVLPLLHAANARIQGLAFIGVPGEDSAEDPFVYNIALIGGSTNVKVQGCWFGLDPAAAPFAPDADGKTPGVHGARAAVASFSWDASTDSAGLVFGTDGDGQDDRAEFNVVVGQLLALHLQMPDVRVSGNYINYLPDGRVFDSVAEEVELHGAGVEFYENGNGHNALIGTDGNGVSDEDEGNLVGPVQYDVYLEFWRVATNVVIAGNYFGTNPSGTVSFDTPPETSLVVLRAGSSARIGSDLNGVSDALEANHIAHFQGNLLQFHGSNNDINNTPARLTLRGNALTRNYSETPINLFQELDIVRFYDGVLTDPETFPEDPDSFFRPYLDPASTPAAVHGTVPLPLVPEDFTIDVDFYLSDPEGLWLGDELYPQGFPQGLVYLGTRRVDGPDDTDAGEGAFTFANLPGVTAATMNRLICAAIYHSADGPVATSLFSHPPAGAEMSVELRREGGQVLLRWLGGRAPFTIQKTTDLTPDWQTAGTSSQWTIQIPAPAAEPAAFYRIVGRDN